MRWKRVDLLRRQLTVAETLTDLAGQISFGPPKTKAAVRTVGLPTFVADELAQLASQPLDRDALVFQSAEGYAVRAGHTSVSVVLDRYGHLFPQHDDALLQALEYSPPSSVSK